MFKYFFSENCVFMRLFEKCGTAKHETHDNITRRKRFACSLDKATETHSEYVQLIASPLL
jgi:hypothetical protein